jgi:hypothetical protein
MVFEDTGANTNVEGWLQATIPQEMCGLMGANSVSRATYLLRL